MRSDRERRSNAFHISQRTNGLCIWCLIYEEAIYTADHLQLTLRGWNLEWINNFKRDQRSWNQTNHRRTRWLKVMRIKNQSTKSLEELAYSPKKKRIIFVFYLHNHIKFQSWMINNWFCSQIGSIKHTKGKKKNKKREGFLRKISRSVYWINKVVIKGCQKTCLISHEIAESIFILLTPRLRRDNY